MEGLTQTDLRAFGLKKPLFIDTKISTGNAVSAWRLLESELGSQLSDIGRDTLDIAEAVYLADRSIRREAGTDALRSIRIAIPLREADRFDENELSGLMRSLALDGISFNIAKRVADAPSQTSASEGKRTSDADTVCLVSGGVDSFGGTVKACEEDCNPVMVSQYTSDSTPEKEIGKAIKNRYGSKIPHISVGNLQVRGKQISQGDPEPTMRLRSFLYLCLAAVTASSFNIKSIWMSENGIMTPGIPVSPSRVGPYTTRTSHPAFVGAFSKWYNGITNSSIDVNNPFKYKTKAEIVTYIGEKGLSTALRSSVSCSRRQFAIRRGNEHCGYCVPCLIRRSAFLNASMSDYDHPSGYYYDCFDMDALPRNARVDLLDLVSFAYDFQRESSGNLLLRYVDLYNIGDSAAIGNTISTLKRFSGEFLATIDMYAKPNLRKALGLP